jgi:hypothetical protein
MVHDPDTAPLPMQATTVVSQPRGRSPQAKQVTPAQAGTTEQQWQPSCQDTSQDCTALPDLWPLQAACSRL